MISVTAKKIYLFMLHIFQYYLIFFQFYNYKLIYYLLINNLSHILYNYHYFHILKHFIFNICYSIWWYYFTSTIDIFIIICIFSKKISNSYYKCSSFWWYNFISIISRFYIIFIISINSNCYYICCFIWWCNLIILICCTF